MSIRTRYPQIVSPQRPMIVSSRSVESLPEPVGPVLARLSGEALRLACAVIELERELRQAGGAQQADDILARYGLRQS